jgi:hypothetical protein
MSYLSIHILETELCPKKEDSSIIIITLPNTGSASANTNTNTRNIGHTGHYYIHFYSIIINFFTNYLRLSYIHKIIYVLHHINLLEATSWKEV